MTEIAAVHTADDYRAFGPAEGEGRRRTADRDPGTRGGAMLAVFTLAAVVVGSIMLVLPLTASADARVSPGVPCVAYADGGATKYEGSGTNVITANGDVALSCHLTLVSGTPVDQPTSTAYGNCELLELPSGHAQLRCHYSLL